MIFIDAIRDIQSLPLTSPQGLTQADHSSLSLLAFRLHLKPLSLRYMGFAHTQPPHGLVIDPQFYKRAVDEHSAHDPQDEPAEH